MRSLIAKIPVGLRQTAIYAFSLAAMKGVSFLMLPIFTHFLSREDYGRLDILQTLADLLSIVFAMGLADTLFRFAGAAEDDAARKRAASTVAGIGLVSTLVFLVLGQAVAPVVADLLPGGADPLHVRLILASLSLTTAILIPLAWLRMANQASWYAAGTLGRVAIQALLAAILLWFGFGVTGVLAAGLIAAFSLAVSLTWIQWRDTGLSLPKGAEFISLMRYSMPLIAAGAAGFVLRSSDRWFVAEAMGPADLADYALAQKLGLLTLLFIQPFEMWWLAKRFTAVKSESGKAAAAATATLGIALCVCAALTVAIVGPVLAITMTPSAYHGAVTFIPWLAGLAALHAATTLMNLGLYAGRTTFAPLLIEVATAVLAIALFSVLIPQYFAMGAIVGAGVALVFRFAIVAIFAQRRLSLPYSWPLLFSLLATGAAGIATIGIASAAPEKLLTFAIAVSICGLLALLSRRKNSGSANRPLAPIPGQTP